MLNQQITRSQICKDLNLEEVEHYTEFLMWFEMTDHWSLIQINTQCSLSCYDCLTVGPTDAGEKANSCSTHWVFIVLTLFNIVSSHRPPGTLYLNSVKLFLILSNQYCSPKWESHLGPSRIALFEDCKATVLTTAVYIFHLQIKQIEISYFAPCFTKKSFFHTHSNEKTDYVYKSKFPSTFRA